MHLTRALTLSVLGYVVIFAAGFFSSSLLGGNITSVAEIPDSFYYLQIALSVVVAALFAYWYFRSPRVKRTFLGGIAFGIVGVLVGAVLDVLIFLPPYLQGMPLGEILAFYLNPLFSLAIALYIFTAGIVGGLLEKRTHAS